MLRYAHYALLLLLLLLSAACTPNEPAPTSTTAPTATIWPQAQATIGRTRQPTPAPPTSTPTIPAVPTQTAVPLPLPTMTPFPTVTPNYVVYETKSIFLSYGGYGGDGGHPTDMYYGRGTPDLVIYEDGQVLIVEGRYQQGMLYRQTTITPAEMCDLRRQIEATGFTQPHSEYYTQREGSDGAGVLGIGIEETFYHLYGPDVPYLVEDLAQGVELIRSYQPPGPLMLYTPTYLALWIEEVAAGDDPTTPIEWPSELPDIADLWTNRDDNRLLIEGELVIPIFELFSHQMTERIFQEGDTLYAMIARPLLPHETPYRYGGAVSPPEDYVPVLDCEGEPALISPAVPTATPTLTAPAAMLSGQGRLLFVVGQYDTEIYVSEADGSNRQRLTYNLDADTEPVWSPDGQRIAFVSERSGNQDIFVMAADGTQVVQLTNNPYHDYSPAWSPDGTQIAFVSDRDGSWETSELYVMNADGSQQQRLTEDKFRNMTPAWSPDGRVIAFVQERVFSKASALTLLHLDGDRPVQERMTITTPFMSRPAWSPDGTQLAVAVGSTYFSEARFEGIHIIDLQGRTTQQFPLKHHTYSAGLDWSADGRYFVFSGRAPTDALDLYGYPQGYTQPDLYALDTTTGELVQITFTEMVEHSPAWWP